MEELAQEKLTPLLLRLKYNDAIADLGHPDAIRAAFVGFQQYLYPPVIETTSAP